MTDRYSKYEDLAAEMQLDKDYRIRAKDRGSAVAILAPHGGTIEPVTSEIAEEIAGDDYSFYAFEALTAGAHGDFHITSHLFDEPQALDLVHKATTSIAIHGRRDDGTDTVWLGGRATHLRDAIGHALREAGFEAEPNKRLPGIHKTNICNRTSSGEGVQLELPMSLRKDLAADHELMTRFSEVVRGAIERPNVE